MSEVGRVREGRVERCCACERVERRIEGVLAPCELEVSPQSANSFGEEKRTKAVPTHLVSRQLAQPLPNPLQLTPHLLRPPPPLLSLPISLLNFTVPSDLDLLKELQMRIALERSLLDTVVLYPLKLDLEYRRRGGDECDAPLGRVGFELDWRGGEDGVEAVVDVACEGGGGG